MASAKAERALRRVIAELAMTAAEDVEAILAELDARERAVVERGLAYLRSTDVTAAQTPANRGPAPGAEGLSDWLALCLSQGEDANAAGAGRGRRLTPATRAALRDCMRRLAASGALRAPGPEAARRRRQGGLPGWLRWEMAR